MSQVGHLNVTGDFLQGELELKLATEYVAESQLHLQGNSWDEFVFTQGSNHERHAF